MKRELLLGPPGTGKTTELLRLVEETLDAGTPPNRVAFLAFTRAAANEAVTRACDRFGFKPSDMPYFRTLHSLTFHMLGLKRDDVMTSAQWNELGAELGLEFSEERLAGDLTVAPTKTLGDKVLAVYQLARARCVPWSVEVVSHDVEPWYVERFVAALDAYKRARHLLDFYDFLDRVHTPLPVDYVIVDEAQDLTVQQWRLLDRLTQNATRLTVAGDDDQTIYRWAGADLDTLLSVPWPQRVLPKSYRLPENMKRLADTVIAHAAARRPKKWSGEDRKGVIEASNIHSIELEPGSSALLIGRSRAACASLVEVARSSGRAYSLMGKSSLDNPAVKAVIAYSRLAKGRAIRLSDFRLVERFSRLRALPAALSKGVIEPGDLRACPETFPPWFEALELPPLETAYIRSVLRRGEKLDAVPSVRVSTIHGAKGAEADHVVLHGKSAIGRNVDREEEVRVWYVGVTRARKRLTLTSHDRNEFVRLP